MYNLVGFADLRSMQLTFCSSFGLDLNIKKDERGTVATAPLLLRFQLDLSNFTKYRNVC